jgi:hypothetical protein
MFRASNDGGPPRIQVICPDGPVTLVASTTWSREYFDCFSHRPTYSSVLPCVSARCGTGYISAVSKKLIPVSVAMFSWSQASSNVFCSPYVIVPRQSRETCKPGASATHGMAIFPPFSCADSDKLDFSE